MHGSGGERGASSTRGKHGVACLQQMRQENGAQPANDLQQGAPRSAAGWHPCSLE